MHGPLKEVAERPDLSLVCVTHNRAASLDRLLKSIVDAIKPETLSYEFVVVLNACTDDTLRVVETYASELPIRAAIEPTPGISFARNTGIRASSGRMIAWLDDDVVIGKKWFIGYERAFLDYPNAAFFGGPIQPRFEGVVDDWFAETWPLFEGVYATRRAATDCEIRSDYPPFGANYAVRDSWQLNRFYDTSLGRKPGFLIIGREETDMLESIMAEGASGRWVPLATVEHIIPAHRRRLSYLVRYFAGDGYFLGRKERGLDPTRRPSLARLTISFAYQLSIFAISYAGARRPDVWVSALIQSSKVFGYILGRLPFERNDSRRVESSTAEDVAAHAPRGTNLDR